MNFKAFGSPCASGEQFKTQLSFVVDLEESIETPLTNAESSSFSRKYVLEVRALKVLYILHRCEYSVE